MQTPTEVFTSIYARNAWRNGSGPGSAPAFCHPWYKTFLPCFLQAYAIRSVLDYGCGDWQFSRFIDFSTQDYIGVDVVDSLLLANTEKFGKPNIRFVRPEQVPDTTYDLVIVKDVFIHWPNAMIKDFLAHIKAKHILVVNDTLYSTNKDIQLGDYRSFDPTLPPFNIPCEKVFVWDFTTPSDRRLKGQYAVWHLQEPQS